ncbi:MAG: energy transducer TonB [Planctomycetota bacterium]
MRHSTRSAARVALAVAVSVIANGALAAFLVAVNLREREETRHSWRPLEIGVLAPPAAPLQPQPLTPPEPREEPPPDADSPPPPSPLESPWSPPDVRAPAGTTLDIDVDLAIEEAFRVLPVAAAQARPLAPEPSIDVVPDILDLWQVDEPPQKTRTPYPVFPRRALRHGIEGRVVVEFVVDREGHVVNAEIVEAEPRGYFESETLRALERWQFRPARLRGTPVACRTRQTFTFTWEGER